MRALGRVEEIVDIEAEKVYQTLFNMRSTENMTTGERRTYIRATMRDLAVGAYNRGRNDLKLQIEETCKS
jgi:hypothetical protein